jgi:uncharacterized RDD family membrane protein YckC
MTDLLTTPERPDTLPPLADRGSRFAAHILDGILTLVIVVVLALGASIDQDAIAVAFGILAVIAWLFYYPIAMQLMGGSTPGKRALGGMYVARADGRPAGFFIGLWRDSILKLILSFLVIVDGLFVLVGKERRALHDLAAGTTVRVGRPRG